MLGDVTSILIDDVRRALGPSGRYVISWAFARDGYVLTAQNEAGTSLWRLTYHSNPPRWSLCKAASGPMADGKPLTSYGSFPPDGKDKVGSGKKE